MTEAYDLVKDKMVAHFFDFDKSIATGDLVLVYFSGHATQAAGNNYLIPVNDTNIKNERDFEDFAVNFNHLCYRLAKQSAISIFILHCSKPYTLTNLGTSNGE